MIIRRRLSFLALAFIAPLVGALLWYAHFTYHAEIDAARNNLQSLAQLAVLDLDKAASGGAQLLSGLGHNELLQGPQTAACNALLAKKFAEFPIYTGLLTFDVEGNMVCDALYTARKQNFSHREYFKRARDTGKTVVGTPIFGGLTKKAVLPILHPLRDVEGRVQSYLFASYDLRRFAAELHNSLNPTVVFEIWGADTTLMARYPPLPDWEGKAAKGTAAAQFIATNGEGAAAEFVDLDGVERIWAVAKMPAHHGSDTWITVGMAKEEAVAIADRATKPLLISVSIGAIVALAAMLLFGELIVRRPVNRVMSAIRRFAGGDRRARIGAPYPGGELGELMRVADSIATSAEAEHEELLHLTNRLEQRVTERTSELQAANDELESFCHSVSHDLRAPLRHVQGFGALLTRNHGSQLDADGLHCVDRIQEASSRMGTLIDDLLHLSRVTRTELCRETVDLSACAREVLATLAQREPDRHVQWRVANDMLVQGDGSLLTCAMSCLLGNAWKFTARTGAPMIEVGCELTADEVVYWVRDNGAGFDMKYADKLFVPFQRLHLEDEFPGVGIGLVTVRRIITRMGGKVWIEGIEGKGAIVRFTLTGGSIDDKAHSAG